MSVLYRLEVELGEPQKLREFFVEVPEELEVVVLLDHHRIEDDEGALGVEEEQRYSIVSTHPQLLLIL